MKISIKVISHVFEPVSEDEEVLGQVSVVEVDLGVTGVGLTDHERPKQTVRPLEHWIKKMGSDGKWDRDDAIEREEDGK